MRKLNIIFVFLYLIVSGCVDEYELESKQFEDILVVQGLLTNEPGPYSVYLSKTISLNSESPVLVEDAVVSIIDQLGDVELLTEIEPGHYTTSAGFATQLGYEYQLRIETTDQLIYFSEPVMLKEGPVIDTLYTEYKQEYNFDRDKYLKGISIKLNSTEWDINDDDLYFKWDYEETWELEQKWDGFEILSGDTSLIEQFRGHYSDEVCWNVDYSSVILLENTNNFNTNKILGKSIIYLNELNHKPYYGYSILVKQFIINKSVYKFWTFLNENSIDNGSVFDNIPYNAESNIECVNNTDEKVYGYFDAAYRSVKRLNLISPVNNVEFSDYNSRCSSETMSINEFTSSSLGKPVYALDIDLEMGTIRFTDLRFCIDCASVTNINNEPEYWIFK